MRRLAAAGLLAALVAGAVPVQATPVPVHVPPVQGTGLPDGGPAALYAGPADAPQLQNTGVWHAEPLLVSGASAYRDGEFLYQDYLYDDHGAGRLPVAGAGVPLMPDGTATYPRDPVYVGNLADLVEVRLKPLGDATAVRLTYNAMTDPALVATTIGLGGERGVLRDLPHDANAQAPADVFVTVHGEVAELVDAATGEPLPHRVDVRVDRVRRQVEVRVPHAAIDPRGRTDVGVLAATGLWDVEAERYLRPPGTDASTAAFYNVAFRYDEPFNDLTAGGNADTVNARREHQQAAVLADGDLTPFWTTVDVSALSERRDDDLRADGRGVPTSGFLNRIHASHSAPAQGRGSASSLQPQHCAQGCVPTFAGQLQPYELYVPEGPAPVGGFPLTLDLHPAGGSYNVGLGTTRQRQFGERGSGSIVLTPDARGTTYWYYGLALVDVFEAWADVARHYPLDPEATAVTGISMGGYGSWKIASTWPQLFAAVAPMVGCTTASTGHAGSRLAGDDVTAVAPLLGSLRNVPVMSWITVGDVLCVNTAQEEVHDELERLGLRHEWWRVAAGDHLTASVLDDYAPMAKWLDGKRRERDPQRVTWTVATQMLQPDLGLGADGAYWVSGVRPSDGAARPSVDVVSHARGPEPVVLPTRREAGVLTDGYFPAAWTSEVRDWAPGAPTAARDALTVTARGVTALTVDPARAGLSCAAAVEVRSDVPLTVTLAGCPPRPSSRSTA